MKPVPASDDAPPPTGGSDHTAAGVDPSATGPQPTGPQPTGSQSTEPQPTDPWERFGWVMATIWLLFLFYPTASVLAADLPVWAKATGISMIAAFAGVYIAGFVRIGRTESLTQVMRVGIAHLAMLVLLTLALVPLLGIWALSTTPFVVALAMFALPLMWGAAIAGGTIAIALIASLATGELGNTWFFIPILAMVATGNGLVRFLEGRQATYLAMEEERQIMAERDRVARDVHDVLGHSLTVISVKAELAERLLDADPAQARSELAQIQTLSRESLAEVRATVAGLRAARLEDEVARVRSALEGAGIRAELPDDVTVVDPRHRNVLAWVLRELVTNVVRHSAATGCQVQLGSTWLRVMDDGVGLGGAAPGHGLRGVAERIGCGELDIQPGPRGRGTVVTVQMNPGDAPPVPASAEVPAADRPGTDHPAADHPGTDHQSTDRPGALHRHEPPAQGGPVVVDPGVVRGE